LLVPGGIPWRQPLPFFIQWDVPDEQRLEWEKPGTHPNGATGWRGISVAVSNLQHTFDVYQRILGLEPDRGKVRDDLIATQIPFHVGTSRVDLLWPFDEEGPIQDVLNEIGEGPFEVTLTVKDLDQTREFLKQRGISPESEDSYALLLPLEQTFGARLVLRNGDNP
jgi:catechol 2,3-dioxygenase-like lactoylglutathione lyase family enzyme